MSYLFRAVKTNKKTNNNNNDDNTNLTYAMTIQFYKFERKNNHNMKRICIQLVAKTNRLCKYV